MATHEVRPMNVMFLTNAHETLTKQVTFPNFTSQLRTNRRARFAPHDRFAHPFRELFGVEGRLFSQLSFTGHVFRVWGTLT